MDMQQEVVARAYPVSEADLVQRARRGDDAAWTELVHAHQAPVFRLAYLLLGDAEEAQDVAQDTFLAALQAIDRFDVGRPVRPWLLRIAANKARNRRRSFGRYIHALGRVLTAAHDPAGETGERTPTGDEEHLWQAVRRLATEDQEVIYLRFFLELPVSETASALGVAPGTVKSRLHRALERLRQVVQREYPWLIEELGDGRTAA